MSMAPALKAKLLKQHYRVLGSREHSGVKLCHWTKNAVTGGAACYKGDFYGIESHRCLQMTPNLSCNYACDHCWRVHGASTSPLPMSEADAPRDILEEALEAQRLLTTGYKGHPRAVFEKWEEAQLPRHVAISLDGEPTQYPYLGEFIAECHARGMTTFLVTNGSHPEVIETLDPLPTQLYVSVYGPNEAVYRDVTNALIPDAWERFNRTLALLPSLDTRTVLRHTLVKGRNLGWEDEYASLDAKAEPDFVECKGYVFVGASRMRLAAENMPSMEEIRAFGQRLAERMGYQYRMERAESKVCLLTRTGEDPRLDLEAWRAQAVAATGGADATGRFAPPTPATRPQRAPAAAGPARRLPVVS